MAFTLLVVSFYFFPFQFRFLPAVNTKMALAALGLVILGIQLARNRNALINKDFFILSIFAAFVSLAGLISVIYNETPDYAYATYIISMWVWISAAYVVVSLIRWVHGTVSVYLLCNYLIALSVAQCILALTMDFSAPVKEFIFSIQDASVGDFFTRKARLSGLGAGLDVAGSRFSAVLIMISILCVNNYQKIKPYLLLYILAFVVIGIIGNMIGRTTTVGMIIAIAYLIVGSAVYMSGKDRNHIWLCISSMLIIAIPILIYGYYNIPELYDNLRFGFEGFFSIAEKGEWETNSTNILENMYRFPQSLKTWLIGDGYFENPTGDPLYTGYQWKGFYMGTDVGYLRFIYYFGLIGLLAFSCYFIKVSQICMMKFSKYRRLFFLILILNFIVWFKVSSDLFPIFALFLCINTAEDDSFDRRVCIIE